MAVTAPARRPSVAGRRIGYAIAAAIDVALVYLINVQPGWQDVPFLTGETRQVLGLVNISLAVGAAANLVYLANDTPLVKALGDLVTTSIGLAVLVRLWQVFPFDFSGYGFDWALLVRVLLVVGSIGAGIGILVQLVVLGRRLAGLPARTDGKR